MSDFTGSEDDCALGKFRSIPTVTGPEKEGDSPDISKSFLHKNNEKTRLITNGKPREKRFEWLFGKMESTDFDILRNEEEEDEQNLPSSGSSKSVRTLGTFTGVFAPVSMGMFSSLLFLRIGYIVGNTGFLVALLQFAIAYCILISTIASISALSSNGAVEGGGVYFMLSRTLGPEFGGAIGTLFFFANVVSSALYLAGCTEGLINSFGPKGNLADFLPTGPWLDFVYCTTINCINLTICLFGSKIFGKTNVLVFFLVLSCVVLTFGSFFTNVSLTEKFVFEATDPLKCVQPSGNASEPANCTLTATGEFRGVGNMNKSLLRNTFVSNLYPKYEYDCSGSDKIVSFFTVFGVLFSGVTGIMSGANMSGELISPSKSIPRGTISACLFTLFIFLILTTLTCFTCSPAILLHDCMYMSSVNIFPPSVALGVFMATFSAGLSNLIGASRILEAVAKDVMFGPFLNFVSKGTFRDNPVTAVITTWFMVELFLLMGSLNNIAQLSSVLFLLSYGTINLTCLFLHLASAPNFRPTYKHFSTYTCLIGLIGAIVMMFAVSAMYSAVGILLCLSLILSLNMFSPIRHANWGSISQALLFHQVRKYLLLLDQRKSHVKFWRPQMLLLVSNPRTNCSLIDFGNALKKSGLYVLGHVKIDRLKELSEDPTLDKVPHWLNLVDHLKVKAFVELTVAGSLREGVEQLVRISGIGAMKPNTILLGFRDTTFPGDDFASPFSPYATSEFDSIFPPLRSETDAEGAKKKRHHSCDEKEYVGIIGDILKQKKNICLCRHFQKLNKTRMFGPKKESIFGTTAKRKAFLDVWLINFFTQDPDRTDISDTTSLLLLQLACIVNMVPRWKTLKLRVFIAVGTQDSSENKRKSISELLEMLRIEAIIKILAWEPNASNKDMTPEHLTTCRNTVKSRSDQTAVTFLYMPGLPTDENEYIKYLEKLTILTDYWPPTVIARGLSPVTSTTL